MFKRLILISLIAFISLSPLSLARAESSILPIQRLGTGIPTSIAASPDGKTLAVGTSIGVWLLDADTLQPVSFIDAGLWVDDVVYGVNGQYLKIEARYYDATSGVYDVTNTSILWLYDSDYRDLYRQSWSAERYLSRTTLFYDLAAKTFQSTSSPNLQVNWTNPLCSIDRKLCAVTGVSNFKIVTEDTKIVTGFFNDSNSKDAAISTDGAILYGLSLGKLSAWDLSTWALIHENSNLFTGTLSQVLWSPDGTQIASGLAVWNVQSAQITSTRQCYSAQSFDCKSYRMAAYHSVYRLDSLTGQHVQRFEPHCAYLQAAKLSSDSSLLATSGSGGHCARSAVNGCAGDYSLTCIWKFDSFTLLAQIPVRFMDLEFSPDNRLIIGKTSSGIEAWDWSTGIQVWSNSADAGCRYWSTLSWGRFHDYNRNRADEACISIDPQGRYLATFNNFAESTDVHLWSMNSGELVVSFNGHTSEITGVAFSPDGSKLAASSLDGTILIWPVP